MRRWDRQVGGEPADDTTTKELDLARAALAHGHLNRAAEHIGNALILDPTQAAVHQQLDELTRMTGPNASDLIPRPDTIGAAGMAALAHVAARKQDYNTAVQLLADAFTTAPDQPWATAADWLRRRNLPSRLNLDLVMPALMRLAGALPDPAPAEQQRTLSPILQLTRALVAAHPKDPDVKRSSSALARRLGAVNEALAWSEEAYEATHNVASAIMLGYALRSADRIEDAIHVWRAVIDVDPDNVDLYLDIAEIIRDRQNRPAEALEWMDRALAINPQHPKIVPAAYATKYAKDRAVTDLIRLVDHCRGHPDHAYAETMLAWISRNRPWLGSVPPPTEATAALVDHLAKIEGKVTVSPTLTQPEPPSAMAALAALVPESLPTVLHAAEPDPRKPLRPSRHPLWRYEDAQPIPIPTVPRGAAVEVLLSVATGWRHPLHAYQAAARFTHVELGDLLGLLTHVPPPPSENWRGHPAQWHRHAIAWTCLGLLHHHTEEPWKTSSRRTALFDLIYGVEDWTTDSALFALVVAGWVAPSIRPEVADTVSDRFHHALSASRTRPVSLLPSLAELCLITPGVPSSTTSKALAIVRDMR